MTQWCIDQHRNTNHMYDTYLPYEFHLRMVHEVAIDFKHLLDDTVDYFTGESYRGPLQDQVTLRTACLRAVWGIGMGENDENVDDPSFWLGLNLLGSAIMLVRNQIK